MRVLITGASGFIGQSLIKYLLGINCEIFNLGSSEVKNSTHFLLKSPSDKKAINDAILEIKPDYVFHLAGSAIRSLNIEQIFTVNTFYCDYLLRAIDKADLGYHTKVVVVGSAAEYGSIEPSQLPISENLPCMPNTLYGMSKLAQTQTALAWQKPKKALVVVRPFNVIGPNMPSHIALGNFVEQIQSIANNGVLMTGNLDSSRDFIAVSDVSRLMWQLIHTEEAYGEVFNLCSGIATRMDKVVDYVLMLSNRGIKVKTESGRSIKGETKIHYGDNTKLQSVIGEYKFSTWEDTLLDVMQNDTKK